MDKIKNMKKINLLWGTLFTLMILKYGYYGFKYFPVIDDWIQYGGYPLYDNLFQDVIIRVGTYATRPLASLSDPYVWGQFWNHMGIPFFIITMLHLGSAYYIYKTLKLNNYRASIFFYIIFLLLPLGTEATYWISASSRLVVGTFFMTLGLYFLSLYINGDLRKRNIILFFLFNLFSYGYYEQVIVLSLISTLILIILNWSKINNKLIALVPIINFILIGSYYRYFRNATKTAARSQFFSGGVMEQFKLVFDRATDIWGRAHIPLYTNGFRRGLEVLLNNSSYLYLLLIIGGSLLCGYIVLKEREDSSSIKNNIYKILIGIILFAAPMGLFFLLESVWISNRNAFTSFLGLALVADGVYYMIPKNKLFKYIKAMGISLIVFVFIIVNISEITDYKNISQVDRRIGENILEETKGTEFLEGERDAIIFNAKPTYVEQNVYFHEHIHNITESYWALTGGLRAVARDLSIEYIRPIPKWRSIKIDDKVWNECLILGIDDDLEVYRLDIKPLENGDIILTTKAGDYFGELINKGQYYFFTIEE